MTISVSSMSIMGIQRCSALHTCRASLIRPHVRYQPSERWGRSQENGRSSCRHWCRAANQIAVQQNTTLSAVTDEERRAALRLPPKPSTNAPTEQKTPKGGSGDGSPPGGDGEGPGTLERVIVYLGGATGLRGSAALLLASLLQLDAFGNIHWDSHDLMVGLALGSPVVLLDIFLILSNWSQKYEFTAAPALEEDVASAENDAAANRAEMLEDKVSETVYMTDQPMDLQQLAAAVRASDVDTSKTAIEDAADTPDIRRIITRLPQSSLAASLDAYQRRKIMGDETSKEATWVQAIIIVVANLPADMLYRAIGLTATAGWITDRLFEAGLDNAVNVRGVSVPTVELGGWLALSVWVTLSLVFAAATLIPSSFKVRRDEETVVREVQTVENTESRAALEKSLTVMVASARNAGGIGQLRDTVETGVLGAAFLMTGNLLASYGSLVAIDACFTVCQNIRAKQYIKEKEIRLKNLMSEATNLKRRLQKIKDNVQASAAVSEDPSSATSSIDESPQ